MLVSWQAINGICAPKKTNYHFKKRNLYFRPIKENLTNSSSYTAQQKLLKILVIYFTYSSKDCITIEIWKRKGSTLIMKKAQGYMTLRCCEN